MKDRGGSQPTSWRMIAAAASGDVGQKSRFATSYRPMIEASLASRWRGTACLQHLDDAMQEVFVECLRVGGVLDSVRLQQPRSFRAFLVGVVRNVARRFEARSLAVTRRQPVEVETVVGTDEDLLRVFEREWARSIVAEALERFASEAKFSGSKGIARVELLRMRFQEGLSIRAIAAAWKVTAERLHREYARARRDFRACLERSIAERDGLGALELSAECKRLTELLS